MDRPPGGRGRAIPGEPPRLGDSMNARTRSQLLALSRAFYVAHAEAFDASRADLPWPGWARMADAMGPGPCRVLDVGCGNGRLARFLATRRDDFEYLGLDANPTLLASARSRQPVATAARCRFVALDFLAGDPAAADTPGASLPEGPFDLVALMGVLHHVPGRDWRLALLRASARRLAPGGLLALATWQFAGRPRFERRCVEWASVGPVEGHPIDREGLEPGDHLLRFGDDPAAPPRYCHQVAEEEFETWPTALDLVPVDRFSADGAQGDLNRYWLLRRN